jgi:gliding motility-associated-like protein
LVTRGFGGYINDGLTEAIGAQLSTPFESNKCYVIAVDVAFFPGTRFIDSWEGTIIKYDVPAVLKLWSSDATCQQKKLLYKSDPISNTQWQTIYMPITPTEPVSDIMFQADYANAIAYGNILLDNIRIESLSVDLGDDITLCDGQKKLLMVNVPEAKIQWSTGAQTNSIEVSEPGNYSVMVEKKGGCIATDNLNVDVLKRMTAFLPNDTTICPGDILILSASTQRGTVRWSNGSTESKLWVDKGGSYSVLVDNGCEQKSESLNVTVDKNYCCHFSAPNVFTPNNDEVNDYFELSTPSDIKQFNLFIYNRWGKLVFKTNELTDFWDGQTLNKEPAVAGVYYWTATINCSHKSETFASGMKGTLMLLR